LPTILDQTPASYFVEARAVLATNARIIFERLRVVPGLQPVRPYGAMYILVGVDSSVLGDEASFVQGLISEESVYCLPGSAFHAPGWFRLVLTYSPSVTEEACTRIAAFARRRHHQYLPMMPG
jgi:tyrosine aminotransferase